MEIERIRVILMDLPPSIRGMTARSMDDNGEEFYTILLNAALDHETLCKAYDHEIRHIDRGDFDRICDVQQLEAVRHG